MEAGMMAGTIMNRITLALVGAFAVAFAAGGSVGMLVGPPGPDRADRPRRGLGLAEELGLTAQQREEIGRIWSDVMGSKGRQLSERRYALHRLRSQKVEALLTDEQRQEYEKIFADHDRQMRQIEEERQRLIQQAVTRTKAILTAAQAKKYEEMRAKRGSRRGPGGRPYGLSDHGRRGGLGTRPTGPHAAGHGRRGPGGPGDRSRDGRRPEGAGETHDSTEP